MFKSSAVAEAIGPGFEDDGDSVDSIVEVEMRSSQPLPDKVGILNGKYLVGSNESQLIYMTAGGEYRLISMEELELVCRMHAKSSAARDKQLLIASEPFEV